MGLASGRLAPPSAVYGARAWRRDRLRLDKFEPHTVSSLTFTDGVGLASGRLAPPSAVSGARAWRRDRLRLDKFEPHTVSSLTFTDGVGFEPTRADAHTISSRAP